MIRGLLTKIKLLFDPPKKGDVYVGDSFDFMAGSVVEQILHGLRDRNGDLLYTRLDGPESYKLTVVLDSMPYYCIDCEVLVRNDSGHPKYVWMKRTQARRIWKDRFEQMIVDGRVKKYDPGF